jgi:hypothetical protein
VHFCPLFPRHDWAVYAAEPFDSLEGKGGVGLYEPGKGAPGEPISRGGSGARLAWGGRNSAFLA